MSELVRTVKRLEDAGLDGVAEWLASNYNRFDHHISGRIVDAIENWDDFAGGEGKSFLEDMERTDTATGEHSVPSMKALVYNFLNGFSSN